MFVQKRIGMVGQQSSSEPTRRYQARRRSGAEVGHWEHLETEDEHSAASTSFTRSRRGQHHLEDHRSLSPPLDASAVLENTRRLQDDNGGVPLPRELQDLDARSAANSSGSAPLYYPSVVSAATSHPPPPPPNSGSSHFSSRDFSTSTVLDEGAPISVLQYSFEPDLDSDRASITTERSQSLATTPFIGGINGVRTPQNHQRSFSSDPVDRNTTHRQIENLPEIDRVSAGANAHQPPAPHIATAATTGDIYRQTPYESDTDDDSEGGISFEVDMDSVRGPTEVLYPPSRSELSAFMGEDDVFTPTRLSSQPIQEDLARHLVELLTGQHSSDMLEDDEMNLDSPADLTPTTPTPAFSPGEVQEANSSLTSGWDNDELTNRLPFSPSLYVDTSMEAFEGEDSDMSVSDMIDVTPERTSGIFTIQSPGPTNTTHPASMEASIHEAEDDSAIYDPEEPELEWVDANPHEQDTMPLPDLASPLPIMLDGAGFPGLTGHLVGTAYHRHPATVRYLVNTYQVNPVLNLLHLARLSEDRYAGWTNDVVFGHDLPFQDFEKYNDDFSSFFTNLYNCQLIPSPHRSFPRVSVNAKRIDEWSYSRPKEITAEDVAEGSDMQGIDWAGLEISKKDARRIRKRSYLNYRNVKDFTKPDLPKIPKNSEFFSFARLNTEQACRLTHFQLRNVLCVTSRNDYYYSTAHTVVAHHPITNNTYDLMDLSDASGIPRSIRISTLGASTGVDPLLIAGGFNGNFALRRLNAPLSDPTSFGMITEHENGITNHIHIVPSRHSSAPVTVFCSNDSHIRLMDTETLQFTSTQPFDFAVNCAATSPCSRLRAVVGDSTDILITDAERGSTEFTISNQHQDFGFAVAWSDDGYTIATGNQDQTVRIFDARNLTRALKVFPTKIAGCRTLRFSPQGSGGKKVLAIAEPADYLHIVDATTWEDAQTVDFWGEIGGMEFSPDGNEVVVANGDRMAGGLMTFQRKKGGRWYQDELDDGNKWGMETTKRMGADLDGVFV